MVWFAVPYGFSWKEISSGNRFLLAVCGAVVVANMLPMFYLPHYTAPITCAILALVLAAMRRIRSWQWNAEPTRLFITRVVPSLCVLLFVLRAASGPLGLAVPVGGPNYGVLTWCSLTPSNPARAAMLRKLERYPGQQLAIVRHTPGSHKIGFGWVYNRADLNTTKVIWARDMGPAKNEELINYFKDRQAWLVDADDDPPALEPYSETADRPSPAIKGNGP